MKKQSLKILIIAGILFVTAITGLAIEKMKITAVCKDVRLYMDGAYSVTIQSGGLRHRTLVSLYRRQAAQKMFLGAMEVTPQVGCVNGIPLEVFRGPGLELTITDKSQPPVRGRPSTLKAFL